MKHDGRRSTTHLNDSKDSEEAVYEDRLKPSQLFMHNIRNLYPTVTHFSADTALPHRHFDAHRYNTHVHDCLGNT